MSGSGARKKRQSKREHPEYLKSAGDTLRAANAVLAVDLGKVPVTRVSQFAVGWLRAAFEQSRVIATLTAWQMGHAAAPNRRAFWELTIRMLWLRDMPQADRAKAADTMLHHDRTNEVKTDEYMRENDLPSNIDVADMDAFFLDVSEDKMVKDGAKLLTKSVKNASTNLWMVYRLWRDDSKWSHATGFLAGSYAPTDTDDTMGSGKPPHTDLNLEAHKLAAIVLTATVADILKAEGAADELATAPMAAYLGAN
ncbi:hypothetical protein V1638_16390 [Pseudarthrobacter sp. J64]|uniref:hypothetical protein n=1 Tax=Pseudarthrobacter sp. J64 TaxID=3116485 RepID=UPI002E813D43|nr:hypothetical protein [Pseudarthrobacter sp. J64]MEE2570956.1 hypothetical protein [Pseudarthrobacter sp. J64]